MSALMKAMLFVRPLAHGLEIRFATSTKGIDPGRIGGVAVAVDPFRVHSHEWAVLGENKLAIFHSTASLFDGWLTRRIISCG